jgi:hypothetical protein
VASRGPTSPARKRTVRMARAEENAGSGGADVGSAVGSEVASEPGSAGADDAAGGVDGDGVGIGSVRDEDSPVHPVTRRASAAMPPYPRMARR